MKTKPIYKSEADAIRIASLPTRPTLPTQYGGKGYTSAQMKEAFDALPLLLVERLNSLIEDILAEVDESISVCLNTGIGDAPKLSDIFADIKSGRFIEYITCFENQSLALYLSKLREDVDKIAESLNIAI